MLTRCKPLLGTLVEITVPKHDAGAVDAAFTAIADVHQRMSFHDETSDLAKLRRAQLGIAVAVAPETVEVLRTALELHRDSGGLFDVTVGRELAQRGFLPAPHGAQLIRYSGTSSDIEIVDDWHVRCHQPVLIDLGGIAKGYAVDRAVHTLRAAGVAEGLVNAGGDLRTFGQRTWDIKLRDGDGVVRKSIFLAESAIASSANRATRRRRFGRLHTPHIGFDRASVVRPGRISVVAERCIIADALTKILIAVPDAGHPLLTRYGARALLEPTERKIG